MTKILLVHPNAHGLGSPYETVIDAHAVPVEIREAFNGVMFVTENGERLAVSMRDSGFEVHYWGEFSDEKGFDAGWYKFNNSNVWHDEKGPLMDPRDLRDTSMPNEVIRLDVATDGFDTTVKSTIEKIDEFGHRLKVWSMASKLADELVEKHGLEDTQSRSMFGVVSAFSKADQHVDLIKTISNWLLNEGI